MLYSPYAMSELDAILSLYLELKSNTVGSFCQVRLMDTDKCLMLLTLEQREVIFLYKILNQTSRETASILDVHHSTVIDKYNKSVERLCSLMNGDTY